MVSWIFLPGDKLIAEMHLGQPKFAYSPCGSFSKNKERVKNLKKQEIHNIFFKTDEIRLAFSITQHTEILKT